VWIDLKRNEGFESGLILIFFRFLITTDPLEKNCWPKIFLTYLDLHCSGILFIGLIGKDALWKGRIKLMVLPMTIFHLHYASTSFLVFIFCILQCRRESDLYQGWFHRSYGC